MTKALTKVVVVCAIIALVGYNIAVLIEPTPKDAISDVVHGWAERWASVPWAIGVLAGHWFWPWEAVLPKPWRYVALITAVLMVVAADLLLGVLVAPIVTVWTGAMIGGLFWGMEDA